jgi:D-alanyl-lipoteichoic acid acyltransferase DltB (MBOAT superfamily)
VLFNSDLFIFAFLPVTLLGYYLLGSTGRTAAACWLIAASVLFYGWWNPDYVLLLAMSVTFNYLCGLGIAKSTAAPRRQTGVLIFAIATNLTALFYYKYCFPFLDFLHTHGIVHSQFETNVILPLGISFFTFTQIGYLVDCKQGVAKERGVTDYFLFVTFFPHLIAGPILHHSEIMPQFAQRQTYRFRPENLAVGFTIFVIGLAKKVLLADSLAATADESFANPQVLGLCGAWSTILSYSLQLYFDFSGYSDMAIGIARMFGVQFPLNFNSPYKARCIIEFWQRWHMTLTRYITLYLYNPVVLWVTRARVARGHGISRRATATAAGFSSMIMLPTVFTMVIAGVWHGAGLQFLVFGVLHGCYLSINHAWRVFGPRAAKTPVPLLAGALIAAAEVLLTFLAVLVGQVFFRAASTAAALTMLADLLGLQAWESLPSDLHAADPEIRHAVLLVVGFVVAWVFPNTQQIMARFSPTTSKFDPGSERVWRWQPSLSWGIAIALLFVLALGGRLGNPARFLYFQF